MHMPPRRRRSREEKTFSCVAGCATAHEGLLRNSIFCIRYSAFAILFLLHSLSSPIVAIGETVTATERITPFMLFQFPGASAGTVPAAPDNFRTRSYSIR
jgi:hypothetical protein